MMMNTSIQALNIASPAAFLLRSSRRMLQPAISTEQRMGFFTSNKYMQTQHKHLISSSQRSLFTLNKMLLFGKKP